MLSYMIEVSKLRDVEPESMTVLLKLPVLLPMLEKLSMTDLVELPSLNSLALKASEGYGSTRLDNVVKICALLSMSALLLSPSDAEEGNPGAE